MKDRFLVGICFALFVASTACHSDPVAHSTANPRQARPQAPVTGGEFIVPPALLALMTPLSDDQKSRIQAIEDRWKPATEAASAAHNTVAVRALRQQARAAIMAVLTSQQQVVIAGYAPMLYMVRCSTAVPATQLSSVKLTSDQLTKLIALAGDYSAQRKALSDAYKTGVSRLNADVFTKIREVLTPDQIAALDRAKDTAEQAASSAPQP